MTGSDATVLQLIQWNLTEIKNPFTNESIVDSEDQNVDYKAGRVPSYQLMEHDNDKMLQTYMSLILKGKVKRIK